MEKCNIAASAAFASTRLYGRILISAVLVMSLAGHAMADVNDTNKDNIRIQASSGEPEYMAEQIKQESAAEWSNRTRFGGDMRLRAGNDRAGRTNMQLAQTVETAATGNTEARPGHSSDIRDRQSRKDPPEQGIEALVELLKKRKIITSAEAARITRQSAGSRGAESQGIASLAALLESKKIISADEAAGFTNQYAGGSIEQNEELKKDIRAQVAKQVHEELTGEIARSLPGQVKSQVQEELPAGKEQIEELNQNVSYLQQKVAEMLYGGKVGELAKESMPEWMKRFSFSGDIRLRYEHDRFNKDNDSGLSTLSQGKDTGNLENTFANTDRFKYRVRLGIAAKIDDQLDAVFRLSTGNTTNPVSTNTLLGDFMNKDNILFDLAYLKWKPSHNFAIYGGRMPNPWFSSDLVWDPDLNFEGLALTTQYPVTESLAPFLTIGAFPLQSSDPANIFDNQHNKWLYAGQIGLEQKDTRGISAKAGVAYYHYHNITGVLNRDATDSSGPTDWSEPLFNQGDTDRGNSLFLIDPANSSTKFGLASEFRELNLTGTLDIGLWHPVHIVFLGDYVKNLAFKAVDVAQRTGIANPPKYVTGYQIGLSVGHPKIEEFGQWKTSLYYKYLGADAVVDAFTDSDFHLGGTNAKGWILGAEFGLAKNTWLSAKWLTADQVSGPQMAIDVLLLDINARF